MLAPFHPGLTLVQTSRSSVNDRLRSMHGTLANGYWSGVYCCMKTKQQCALIGCYEKASDKHHIGGASSPMIWVCKACHGRIHGLQWNSEHSALTRAGLAKARAQGRRGGNPKLLDGDRDFIDAMNAARKERNWQRTLEGLNDWLPIVVELRPKTIWQDVARVVTQKTGEKWSPERLRRIVLKLVTEGLIDGKVMEQAPMRIDERTTDHLIPLIKSIASSGRTLAGIASELERLGERTPRGGARWHPSSVAHLLKGTDALAELPKTSVQRRQDKMDQRAQSRRRDKMYRDADRIMRS